MSATTSSSASSATRSTSGARQRLESNVSLTQRWEKWNFFGRLFFYQDLTTDEPVELQRLPELRLSAFQQPVPWLPGLLFEMDSSYNYFVRDIGSDGQRLDVAPRLSYPVSPGGLFTITPRVGFRETLYDTRVVGTKEDRGFIVEDTEKEFTVRSLFEAGVDFDARAQRVFDLGGAFGIQKLQHLIEPRVSYNYLDGDDSKDLPQWDGIDTDHAGPHGHLLPDEPAQGARGRRGGPPGARVGGHPLHAQPDLHDRPGPGGAGPDRRAHDDRRATATARRAGRPRPPASVTPSGSRTSSRT